MIMLCIRDTMILEHEKIIYVLELTDLIHWP